MITCTFEDGGTGKLRHVVAHALVEKDGKILLLKRSPKISEGGKWSIPSGFMSRDETITQCILRELQEETGWRGEIVSLFRINSNPNRPHEDRQNISIEFIVKPIEKNGDGDWESTDMEWFAPQDLPSLDTLAFDHGESVALFLKYKKQTFSLPILV